jgi:accessory gene regulator B
MRFINKWSYACACWLTRAMNESHQKRSIYYYGFFIIFGAIVKGVILVSVAFALGVLLPSLLITVAFASLRTIAGGYHMDTLGKCLFVSMGLFVVAALVAQHTYDLWSMISLVTLVAITFITGLYILIRYAPKDTPNRPITNPKEIRKFKSLSIVYLFIITIGVVALTTFRYKLFALSLCFGILLELFAISPTGHKFFDIIKYKLTKKKSTKSK